LFAAGRHIQLGSFGELLAFEPGRKLIFVTGGRLSISAAQEQIILKLQWCFRPYSIHCMYFKFVLMARRCLLETTLAKMESWYFSKIQADIFRKIFYNSTMGTN